MIMYLFCNAIPCSITDMAWCTSPILDACISIVEMHLNTFSGLCSADFGIKPGRIIISLGS